MNIDKDTIINFFVYKKQYKSLFSDTFNFSNHYRLPFIFITSKFHMNPFKFRYICYTSKSINKPRNETSIMLSSVLRKLVLQML